MNKAGKKYIADTNFQVITSKFNKHNFKVLHVDILINDVVHECMLFT